MFDRGRLLRMGHFLGGCDDGHDTPERCADQPVLKSCATALGEREGIGVALSLLPGLAWLERVHRRRHARASPQRILEIRRPPVLSQKVAKGFVGKLLKFFHLVAGKQVEGLPRFIVELDALASHQTTPSTLSNTAVTTSKMTMDPKPADFIGEKEEHLGRFARTRLRSSRLRGAAAYPRRLPLPAAASFLDALAQRIHEADNIRREADNIRRRALVRSLDLHALLLLLDQILERVFVTILEFVRLE